MSRLIARPRGPPHVLDTEVQTARRFVEAMCSRTGGQTRSWCERVMDQAQGYKEVTVEASAFRNAAVKPTSTCKKEIV
jgi:hypothetical protein